MKVWGREVFQQVVHADLRMESLKLSLIEQRHFKLSYKKSLTCKNIRYTINIFYCYLYALYFRQRQRLYSQNNQIQMKRWVSKEAIRCQLFKLWSTKSTLCTFESSYQSKLSSCKENNICDEIPFSCYS